MRITFEIPDDIGQELRAPGRNLSAMAREVLLLLLDREEKISHAPLREALGLSWK